MNLFKCVIKLQNGQTYQVIFKDFSALENFVSIFIIQVEISAITSTEMQIIDNVAWMIANKLKFIHFALI